MGARIRAHDWATTPLGSPDRWPQSLRSALSICLNSSFPTAIYWGPELRLLYNDAWAPIPAERHPWALGQPAAEVWDDIWSVVGPQFGQVLATGQGFSTFDQMLPMVRGGEVKETYWNYSITPIRGEDGSVIGIFNQGHETTAAVLAERQKTAETDRLRRMFDQAPGFMAMLRGPEHVFELVNAAYMQLVGHRDVVGRRLREALPEIEGQGYFELLDKVFASGKPFAGRALPVDLQHARGGAVERRYVDLVYQPITDAAGAVSGIFVEGSDVTERVLAEAELRESEARHRALSAAAERRAAELRAVLESIPDAVYIGGAEGITLANQPALDQLGFSTQEELNRGVGTLAEEIRTRDARDGTPITVEAQPFTRALGGERVVQDVLVRHRATGEERILRCAAAPVVIDGRVIAAVAVNTDVTSARRAEAELRDSEARLKFLDELGAATAGAFAPREIMATTASMLGGHLRVTRCAYADVEADGDRFTIRDDWTAGVPSSTGEYSLDRFGSRAAADLRTGRTLVVRDVDAELPAEDGADMFNAIGVKAVVCCPLVKRGRLVAMMAVHQSVPRDWLPGEISLVETVVERAWAHIERVRDEAALRESEERLRLIVEGARDYAIFTTDPEGRIDAWLPGAANVFGWSPSEAVGQPMAMTFTPEDREAGVPAAELETARRDGHSADVRWHSRKDGSRVYIEGSVSALRRSNGSIQAFLKIGQDVTGRKAAEEAQALLAREVDHRAKNALTIVQTMLRLTRADDVPSFVKAVEGRVAALARAQTLLAESRWNGAVLHSMLEGELAPFLAGQRVELSGPTVVLPPGTAQALAMAAHELATNAAKYGALSIPQGHVAVTWRVDDGSPDLLRLNWAETGGPAVAGSPMRRGFGSRVLEGTVRRQLGGAVSLTWARAGLICDIEVPLARGLSDAGVADAPIVAYDG